MATHVTDITAAETRRRKAVLEFKLQELLHFSGEREGLQVDYLADPIDQVKSSTDREITVLQLNHYTRLLRDVQCALDKMEAGDYGVCEGCESAIPRRRLDAVPWARLCVPCQSAAEAAANDTEPAFRHAA